MKSERKLKFKDVKKRLEGFVKNEKVRGYGIIALVGVLLAGSVYISSRNTANKNTIELAQKNESSKTENVSVNANTNYFEAFRLDRDNTRSKEIAYLDTIIAQADTDNETLKEAQEQKMSIVECMETEFTVEKMIKSKGFDDVAVTFHKGSVNVIVDSNELSDSQVAQILDIVKRETGEEATNIKVSLNKK